MTHRARLAKIEALLTDLADDCAVIAAWTTDTPLGFAHLGDVRTYFAYLAPRVRVMLTELRRSAAAAGAVSASPPSDAQIHALLRDVACAGVTLDDPRIPYVTVQIDRGTWEALHRLAETEDACRS